MSASTHTEQNGRKNSDQPLEDYNNKITLSAEFLTLLCLYLYYTILFFGGGKVNMQLCLWIKRLLCQVPCGHFLSFPALKFVFSWFYFSFWSHAINWQRRGEGISLLFANIHEQTISNYYFRLTLDYFSHIRLPAGMLLGDQEAPMPSTCSWNGWVFDEKRNYLNSAFQNKQFSLLSSLTWMKLIGEMLLLEDLTWLQACVCGQIGLLVTVAVSILFVSFVLYEKCVKHFANKARDRSLPWTA